MRRAFATAVIILAAIMLLAGCDTAIRSPDSKITKEAKESSKDSAGSSDDKETDKPGKPVKKKKRKKKRKRKDRVPSQEDIRKTAYQEILYKYKEAQDRQYTMDDVVDMGLYTELVQRGWPSPSVDVKYLYYDVDSDGNDELIITYYGELIDIYGYDGNKAQLAFSTPYRGIAELHPDGMLELFYSVSVSGGSTSWYQFDATLGNYFEVYECISQDGNDSYHTFGAYNMNDEERRQVEESYHDIGTYPVWLYEWSAELTKEEYDGIVPKTDPIKLPEGDPISDINLPLDYVYAK